MAGCIFPPTGRFPGAISGRTHEVVTRQKCAWLACDDTVLSSCPVKSVPLTNLAWAGKEIRKTVAGQPRTELMENEGDP